jgi:hypothetical protein
MEVLMSRSAARQSPLFDSRIMSARGPAWGTNAAQVEVPFASLGTQHAQQQRPSLAAAPPTNPPLRMPSMRGDARVEAAVRAIHSADAHAPGYASLVNAANRAREQAFAEVVESLRVALDSAQLAVSAVSLESFDADRASWQRLVDARDAARTAYEQALRALELP